MIDAFIHRSWTVAIMVVERRNMVQRPHCRFPIVCSNSCMYTLLGATTPSSIGPSPQSVRPPPQLSYTYGTNYDTTRIMVVRINSSNSSTAVSGNRLKDGIKATASSTDVSVATKFMSDATSATCNSNSSPSSVSFRNVDKALRVLRWYRQSCRERERTRERGESSLRRWRVQQQQQHLRTTISHPSSFVTRHSQCPTIHNANT